MTPYLLCLTSPTGERSITTVYALSPTAALAAYGITDGTAPDGSRGFVGIRTSKGIART